jgi:hypothetical protein
MAANSRVCTVGISDKWFLFPKRAFAVIVTFIYELLGSAR